MATTRDAPIQAWCPGTVGRNKRKTKDERETEEETSVWLFWALWFRHDYTTNFEKRKRAELA